MNGQKKRVFLADDDADDRELFEDAIREIASDVQLIKATDGKELMELLEVYVPPQPEVIFLDVNMPLKNGFECLTEIRQTQKFSKIPIVIYSTSCEKDYIDKVYEQGADYYICKPETYPLLRDAIFRALSIDWQRHEAQPPRDKFILS